MTIIKGLIFDLDGTLLNTLEDLADSINTVLRQDGLPVHPAQDYKHMIGSGARLLVARAMIASGADVRSEHDDSVTGLLERFTGIYGTKWNRKTKPYAGVTGMLDLLTSHHVPMAVLSNKPQHMTAKAVAHFFPDQAFAPVIGQRDGIPEKPDPVSALEIAEAMGLKPHEIAFVGDSGSDMQTAVRAGMVAVGVTWGFRKKMELKSAGADRIVDHPDQITALPERSR